jgi:glycosyltransferase involved in cell wall biosynthesis
MKITVVVPRYLPHLGGIENHVASVTAGLRERGHQITVATQLEGDTSLAREEVSDNGITIRRFPSVAKVRGQGLSPALWRWVRAGAGDADLVHLQNFHALTTFPATALARPPFVLTPHYLGPGEGRAEQALHATYAVGMRRALRKVSRVVCVTKSEAELFGREIGFGARCRVIPNGVDAAAIQAAVPADAPAPLLVVAGRMEEYKQPQLAVDALAHLPGYTLALIGTGPMEGGLRRRADAHGVRDRVLLPGRMSPSRLFAWYRAAAVVVSLSRRECYGLTLAEGLAAGAAVVASDIGPHRDVVAGAGPAAVARLLPPSASPTEVAAAIADATRDADSRTSDARPVITTWDDVADRTEELYREVLAVG